MAESGYCNCQCRDCFDIAIANDCRNPKPTDLCNDCEEAGCKGGDAECSRDDAYGVDEESEAQ